MRDCNRLPEQEWTPNEPTKSHRDGSSSLASSTSWDSGSNANDIEEYKPSCVISPERGITNSDARIRKNSTTNINLSNSGDSFHEIGLKKGKCQYVDHPSGNLNDKLIYTQTSSGKLIHSKRKRQLLQPTCYSS